MRIGKVKILFPFVRSASIRRVVAQPVGVRVDVLVKEIVIGGKQGYFFVALVQGGRDASHHVNFTLAT